MQPSFFDATELDFVVLGAAGPRLLPKSNPDWADSGQTSEYPFLRTSDSRLGPKYKPKQ